MEASIPTTNVPQTASIATPATDININTAPNSNDNKILYIFGAIALGIFLSGATLFMMANYKALKNLEKQIGVQPKI